MKTIVITLLTLVFSTPTLWSAPHRVDLDGDWQFRQSTSSQWFAAKVPGCTHTDLLNNKLIDDPFMGNNEKFQQWIGEKDWEYCRTFIVTREMLDSRHLELVMEGLDTYADVFINDYKVLAADNMFRTWKLDPTHYLHEGENQIRIYFHSVFETDLPKYLASPFKLQAWPNNDQADIWLSLYARKAGYNYGWDWGPRLITSGVWRPIYLQYWDDVRIDNSYVYTKSIGKRAIMQFDCNVLSDCATSATISISTAGAVLASQKVALTVGENTISLPFEIKNPQLWWCNGLGNAHLYDFDITVRSNRNTTTQRVTTGIRTIEVVRECDTEGRSLYFKVNGKRVFMKGANYIPLDNFPNRVSADHYEYIVKSAADVNMNMLRVWGGGLYEDSKFYSMCDKYGLLVWQDMMFACGMFPADEHYLANVSAEITDNIKRLRNHPSIAMWNGNNENEISYYEWGWRNQYSQADDRVYQQNLKTLFYKVVPQAIYAQDRTRYYHPTSPDTGYNGIGYNQGDVHFWWVWKGGWLEEYEKSENIGRFMSEYGFQAYPDMHTIRKFAKSDDMQLNSEVVLLHQRAMNDATRDPNYGNDLMKMYMNKYFKVPADFEEFIYMSQLQQAEAVKIAIEAHRRAKPYCMGTLYWQINDCWPAASWSSIDYYGRWKALHYYTKDAYSDVLISPYKQDGMMKVDVVSDRYESFKGDVSLELFSIHGELLDRRELSVEVPANAAVQVAERKIAEMTDGRQGCDVFVVAKIYAKGLLLSQNIFYPEYSNCYHYDDVTPEIEITKSTSGVRLSLCASALVRGLYLDVDDEQTRFDRNYITLIPLKREIIDVFTDLSVDEFRAQLKLLSLNKVNQ